MIQFSSSDWETPFRRARVLILSDDPIASHAWQHVLNDHDIEAATMGYVDLEQATARLSRFHLLIVDHHGDSQRALSLCGELRIYSPQPLLLFTYNADERLCIKAYQAGVEECIAKPISNTLFVAKVQAWLRQLFRQDDQSDDISVDAIRLDSASRMLEVSDTQTKLSKLEYRLISLLLTNRDQIMTAHTLAERVWPTDSDATATMLKNLVYRLRRKLVNASISTITIQSVPGKGYICQVAK